MNWDEQPYFSCELTWESINETYVPKKVVTVRRTAASTTRRELTLNWNDVNRPLPENTFTIDGFALHNGDRIVDMRGPTPISRRVGEPDR
jgi:hypothetical protein